MRRAALATAAGARLLIQRVQLSQRADGRQRGRQGGARRVRHVLVALQQSREAGVVVPARGEDLQAKQLRGGLHLLLLQLLLLLLDEMQLLLQLLQLLLHQVLLQRC